ncbi:PAS domain-containing sensor histidine kinase [Halocola ammonii]
MRLSQKQSPKAKLVKGETAWTLDSDYNLVSWNDSFSLLSARMGLTQLPANFFDLDLTDDQKAAFETFFKKALRGEFQTRFISKQISLQESPGYLRFEKMKSTQGEWLLCTFSPIDEIHQHKFLLNYLESLPSSRDEKKMWFYSIDNEGSITYLSENAERLTGYANRDRIGQHVLGKRNEKEQKELLEFWDSYVKRPRPFDNLFTSLTTSDGKKLYLRGTGVPSYDNEGNLLGYSGTMSNITEEKKLYEKLISSEELNRTIVETLPYSFMILTADGKLIDYHPHNAEEDLGLTNDSIGKSIDQLLKTKKQDFLIAPIDKVLKSGKTITLNVELTNNVGRPVDYEIRYILLHSSKNQVLAVMRDITDSKEAQQELVKSMNELNLSNRELEQFAYTVSHDLQEPMRLVSSYLQLIKMKSRNELDEKSQTYLSMAINSSDQMRNLVTNLLEYSRLGHQKLKVKPLEFGKLLESLKLIFDKKLQEKQGKIEVGEIPDFVCDPLHFSLLLQNLVGNALKFSKEDTPPVIKISGRDTADGKVELCVEDNGVGMERSRKDSVFGAFERLNNTAHIEGHGLGMSICRKIVISHGGKIWVESELGKGTQVYFTMPKDSSQIPTDS